MIKKGLTVLIGKVSLSKRGGIYTYQEASGETLDPQMRYPDTDFVRCFRHEGEDCPRCDGSGFRPRARCASCGVPAGRPSQGGKALSPERGAKSWKELRSLPLYCMDCNPRFFGAGLALFEEIGG